MSDRHGDRLGLYTLLLAAAAVCFAALSTPLPFAAWLGALLGLMLAGTALTTLTDALAADEAASRSAVAYMTTYTVVLDTGAALGPLAAAASLAAYGAAGLALTGTAALTLLAAAWLAFGRIKRQPVTPGTSTVDTPAP
ncbi:hypothetical protein [Paenibacillus sp. YYML68]|uniref:hypothetical protein n=1 Tax=Paenibacillus sp. YYML68 TaxID=2909250 RepID=UPI0024934018|nr:hypothetical protein [Paenibacillus sp. YYML68]